MASSSDGQEPAVELTTVADLPFHVLGRHPKSLLVGHVVNGGVEGESTRDWFDRIRDLSLGLGSLGITRGDRVAIMSESRPEWLLADLAILSQGAVTVPVYSTLTAAQARFIVRDSGARLALVSTLEQLEKLQHVRHDLPALEAIVVFETVQAPSPSVLSLADLQQRGHARMMAEWGVAREFRDRAKTVRPGDLATIIYTSGTTGEPKGVMLSHANLISNLFAGQAVVQVTDADVSLSYLPLSHSLERLVSYVYLAHGVTIVFAESMETVGRDMTIVTADGDERACRASTKSSRRGFSRRDMRFRSRGGRCSTGVSTSRTRGGARSASGARLRV